MASRRGDIDVSARFLGAFALLFALAALAGFMLGQLVAVDPVRVVSVPGPVPRLSSLSAARLSAALGPPSQSFLGEQIGLPAGLACRSWQSAEPWLLILCQ